jgi:peptidoglycan biosynthesis protein MviN/MurJ (putative lipid II flippase)
MLVNLVLTVCIHVALYWVLSTGIGGWHGIGVNGMPISDAIFYFANSIALILLLRRRIGGFDVRGISSMFLRMVLATCVGSAAAWGVSLAVSASVHGLAGAIAAVVSGLIVGGGIILVLGKALRVDELSVATKALARAIGRRGAR